MKLLLDTHVFLWWRADDPCLTTAVRRAISRAEDVFVSVASAWEIAIKVSLGKLRIPSPVEEAVLDSRFSPLPLTFTHAAGVTTLPFHHRDPFDRMLVSQAQAEQLTIVTADRKFEPYGVPVMWI